MLSWPVNPMKVVLGFLAYGALCYWQWVRLYSEKKPGKTRVAPWALREGLVKVLEEDEKHVVYMLEPVGCASRPDNMERLRALVRRWLHFRN